MNLILSLAALFALALSPALGGQEIVTAENYLERVAARYGEIRDYEARIAIKTGNTEMYGTVSYLKPSFLRIDFSKPAEQVIAFNGEMLTIYLPEYRATLNQSVESSRAGAAQTATGEGLLMMRRNYVPSFVSGPEKTPLEDSPSELVVKLRLTRRAVSEGFRELILYIDPQTLLIRRIEGRTIADALLRFDYTQIRVNQGIPENRFIYDSPASANNYNNFLFRDD